jgi:hypothetical protein
VPIVVFYVLAVVGFVIVALTRLRLHDGEAGGRHAYSPLLVHAHTIFGVLGLSLWTYFLVAHDKLPFGEVCGVLGLGLVWITSVVGLALLVRWLPSKGRHAADDLADDWWGNGAGLSLIAHLGMFFGTLFTTWAYVTGAI